MALTKSSMEALHPMICESIRDGGQFVFYPSGISMLPTIKEHEDCVVLVEANNLQKNDLILYRRENKKYVLHRIMKIHNDTFTLCGDNQIRFEHNIKSDQIIAMAQEIRKKDGKVLSLAEIRSYNPPALQKVRRVYDRFYYFSARVYRKIFPRKKV